jgi:MOSC domain-containing protein YiiM
MSALERAWAELSPSPAVEGTVRLICLRQPDGTHRTPDRASITKEGGVVGDRWALSPKPNPDAQVTLMNIEVAKLVAGPHPIDGVGDNFLVDLDLSEHALPVGCRVQIGSAILEVTAKPHRGCKKFQERFGDDAMEWVAQGSNAEGRWPGRRLRGVNCRVIEAGEVALLGTIRVLGG